MKTIDDKIESFRNREIKAKKIFSILKLDKPVAYEFVKKYHYLADAKFFAKFCYGLFIDSELVGVSTFSNPQGIVAMKSWFNLNNSDSDRDWET